MSEYNGTNNDGLVIPINDLPTDEQINKDLHEQVVKKCWHEFYKTQDYVEYNQDEEYTCKKCGSIEGRDNYNPDYLNSWNDYGELVRSISEYDLVQIYAEWKKNWQGHCFTFLMLDPRKGSMAIWEFFCKSHTEKEES
jgi:RNase P subunit RPR2